MPRKGSIAEVAESYDAISAAFSYPINMSSATFYYTLKDLDKIKESVKNEFNILSETEDETQNILARISVIENKNKSTIIFYGTGRCLLQGKDCELFNSINSLLTKVATSAEPASTLSHARSINEDELYLKKEYIIGFDEAGKGEPFGPLVFGSVLLPKSKVHIFEEIKPNIKTLSFKELNYYANILKQNGIRIEYLILSAIKISTSSFNLNRLMDLAYVRLIRKYSGVMNKDYLLAIDNYGISNELKDHLDKLERRGIANLCQAALDSEITATKLASIVARQIRISRVRELEEQNRFPLNGGFISFGKGANNSQAIDWLKAFRERYPTFEFPDFVRKNWANVKQVEQSFPKKFATLSVSCPSCKQNISKILAYYNKNENKLSYYCASCVNEILLNPKEAAFDYLLCDTNAYVIGIVSKDLSLSPTPIFENSCLVIPTKIIDEIDTIALSKKRGALKELERLKELEQNGRIKLLHREYEITRPFDADKKLYDLIARNNGLALISADQTVADCSHARGAFVFKIIHYPPRVSKTNP